jgi:hypothetical protein
VDSNPFDLPHHTSRRVTNYDLQAVSVRGIQTRMALRSRFAQ